MFQPNTLLARAAACVVVSLSLLAATDAAAQTQTTTERRDAPPAANATPTPTSSVATPATNEPDLSITGSVTARELRFEVVPTPKVEFPGRPRRETVWEAERTNLPPQVEPGVTYRDIGIRLKITSVFADIERIVAEALGEIPTSDDATPKTNSNDNTQPPSANAQPQSPNAQPPSGNVQTPSADAQTASGNAQVSHVNSQTLTAGNAKPGVAPRATSPTQTSHTPSSSSTETSPAPSASRAGRDRRRSGVQARRERPR